MKNIMVDLETLGTSNNAVIISIGAVEFDVDSGVLGRELYMTIDPQSCVSAGLEIDASTVIWWMQQSDAARSAFRSPQWSLASALQYFSDWYPADADALWGNGATFDNVLLSNAYRKTGLEQPWRYSDDRCYRTLKSLRRDIKQEAVGTAHNALDDAKYQALHAIKLLKNIA